MSDSQGKTCRYVRVHGRVQGVGFRESTREEADQLGVTGWVRNDSDGSVEAIFCGTPGLVDTMVAWCRKGPPLARVLRLDIQDHPVPDPFPTRFAVRW
ncbi:MAG: acylphosphatase [Magnetococcales bacterium]|nr:acylphosphatase [Magnetococcales bacterium]